MTQIGYGVGLFFIVPLGDLVENRRLVLSVMSAWRVVRSLPPPLRRTCFRSFWP